MNFLLCFKFGKELLLDSAFDTNTKILGTPTLLVLHFIKQWLWSINFIRGFSVQVHSVKPTWISSISITEVPSSVKTHSPASWQHAVFLIVFFSTIIILLSQIMIIIAIVSNVTFFTANCWSTAITRVRPGSSKQTWDWLWCFQEKNTSTDNSCGQSVTLQYVLRKYRPEVVDLIQIWKDWGMHIWDTNMKTWGCSAKPNTFDKDIFTKSKFRIFGRINLSQMSQIYEIAKKLKRTHWCHPEKTETGCVHLHTTTTLQATAECNLAMNFM